MFSYCPDNRKSSSLTLSEVLISWFTFLTIDKTCSFVASKLSKEKESSGFSSFKFTWGKLIESPINLCCCE
ncbi:hypothetical protein OVS_04020 [Mycoplasma ovis str. Michigan]|uniref:Uncharacterized protein n=1 Tax=Mycoplasma ovis str. Michigan TaxID=1415773 RepID=A0ABM5P271_9MOLU|nr:hypothetical protein OVS_04020 [Mycoplasma ovis str. Michigan]